MRYIVASENKINATSEIRFADALSDACELFPALLEGRVHERYAVRISRPSSGGPVEGGLRQSAVRPSGNWLGDQTELKFLTLKQIIYDQTFPSGRSLL